MPLKPIKIDSAPEDIQELLRAGDDFNDSDNEVDVLNSDAEVEKAITDACGFDADPRTHADEARKCLGLIDFAKDKANYSLPAAVRYLKGNAHFVLSQNEEAKAEYDKVLEAAPDYFGGYLGKGSLALRNNELDVAYINLNKALELNPDDHSVYSRLGYYEYFKDNYHAALSRFSEALSIDPKCVQTWRGRALAFWGMSVWKEMLYSTAEALKIDPENAELFALKAVALQKLGETKEAEIAVQDAMELGGENTNVLLVMSSYLREAGRYEEALSYARRIRIDGGSNVNILNETVILKELDRCDEALNLINDNEKFVGDTRKFFLVKGQVLFKMGRYEESIEMANRLIALSPKNINGHVLKAKSLRKLDRCEDAVKVHFPFDEKNAEYISTFRSDEADTKDFLECADEVLEKDRSDRDAWVIKVNNAFCFKIYETEPQNTLELARSALDNFPGDELFMKLQIASLIHLGEKNEVSERIEVLFKQSPNSADTLIFLLNMMRRNNMGDVYETYLPKLVELNPECVEGLMHLGHIMIEKEKYDEAEMCADKILEVKKGDPKAFYLKSLIFFKQSKFDEALASAEKCLKNSPESVECMYLAADIFYHEKGDTDKAEEYLNKILLLNQNEYSSYLRLVDIYARNNEYQKAIDVATESIAKCGDKALMSYFFLAILHRKMDNLDAAKESIQTYFSKGGNDSDAYLVQSLLLHDEGDLSGSIDSVNRSLELNPENVRALIFRSNLFATKGEFNKALTDLELAIKLDPNNESAAYKLGLALADVGDSKRAKEVFDNVVKKSQGNSGYYGLAKVSYKEGDLESALGWLDLVEQNESIPYQDPNILKSMILYKLGRYDEALSSLNKAKHYKYVSDPGLIVVANSFEDELRKAIGESKEVSKEMSGYMSYCADMKQKCEKAFIAGIGGDVTLDTIQECNVVGPLCGFGAKDFVGEGANIAPELKGLKLGPFMFDWFQYRENPNPFEEFGPWRSPFSKPVNSPEKR